MPPIETTVIRAALHDAFDASTLARGRVYQMQNRVVSCLAAREGEDWKLMAEVRGSEVDPYEVEVHIGMENGALIIDGLCSCPMAEQCKHAAAVLLHVLERPEQWFNLPAFTGPSTDGVQPPLDPTWQHWLQQVDAATAPPPSPPSDQFSLIDTPPEEPERLLYVLSPAVNQLKIEVSVARRLKAGGHGAARNYYFANLLPAQPASSFIRPVDRDIARKVMLAQPQFNAYQPVLEGESGAELLPEILATGRCYWRGSGKARPTLRLGASRPATAVWSADAQGRQQATFRVEPPASVILPLCPPWYLEETTGTCGPLETGLPPAVARAWLSAPPVSPASAPKVSAELARRSTALRLPPPISVQVEEIASVKPIPCLRLYSAVLKKSYYGYGYGYGYGKESRNPTDDEFNFAHLEFDYAGVRVPAFGPVNLIEHFSEGKLRRLHRDLPAEQKAGRVLNKTGLDPAEKILFDHRYDEHVDDFTTDDPAIWFEFAQTHLPKLRAKGWRIDVEDSFRYQLVEAEGWYGDAEAEAGEGWFGVELGVIIDGEKVNLLPLLLKLLKTNPGALSTGSLAQLKDDALIPVPLGDGRTLPFPVVRARQMLGVLIELLDPNALNAKGKLRLNKLRAAEFAGDAEWRWLGNTELQALSQRLRSFEGIKPVPASPRLNATLRPYQQEGLNWLQFLREYELAGILADDMGLGKTVQTLAHLLAEKESGRMDRPSLVIAPTSLMTNWRQEAERFAPDLRVLVLHGLERKQHFEKLRDHDLIITSYPLLPRDQKTLLEHDFHYVILDEAQFIKNPKTIYAQVACQLKARHRLCLTGTPMENHLGELWSLFHFLLPGFLSDEIRFNSVFRRPIEKGKDDERRRLLARRVAPFILRRRKDEVVKELPPKTEIIQNVELSGAQRDLYESVRLAMHERVKAEVDSKGLSRSHIIILDALLKLRQICCHPQLLSLPSAKKVKESAKLELLMDLLPEMIQEGRRILLFSQFTSMLAIIETALGKAKIPYVILTGQTTDRATPVDQFQKGEVPLFLISLKAGGTGLNLTAADTVIHYDPWWNPAVENQATDRAHRIGQEKKVFVYKLLTVGTVEEKIAALQQRKRELVEGLLNEERRENLKLTPEDLDVLFAPLA